MSENTVNIKELFDALDKLATHGFEYFIGSVGLVLLLIGFVASPIGPISEWEMLIIAASGAACTLASVIAWFQKANINAKINIEKIAYEKHRQQEITLRLIVTNSDKGLLGDLTDIK